MQDWSKDPKLRHYEPLFQLEDVAGEAFVARDLQTPKAVLIRRVPIASALQRCTIQAQVKQARRLLAFNHRHLVKVVDAWLTQTHGVLVSDFLEGGSLFQLRAYGREHWGQLSASVALSVLLDAAQGVAGMRRYDPGRPAHPLLARDLFIAIDGRALLLPVLDDDVARQQVAAVLPLDASLEAQDTFYFAAACWEVLFECDVATHRRIHEGGMPPLPDQLPKSVVHLLDQVLTDPESLGGFQQFIEALAEAAGYLGPTEARREVSVWAHAAFYEFLQRAAQQLGPMYLQRITDAPETIAVSQATMGLEGLKDAVFAPLPPPALGSKQPVPHKSTIRARSDAPEAAATVYCPKAPAQPRPRSELSARAPAKPKPSRAVTMTAGRDSVELMPVRSVGLPRDPTVSKQPTARPHSAPARVSPTLDISERRLAPEQQINQALRSEPASEASEPQPPPAGGAGRSAGPSRPALRKAPLTEEPLPPDSSLAAALVQLVEDHADDKWLAQTGVRSKPAPSERKVAGD